MNVIACFTRERRREDGALNEHLYLFYVYTLAYSHNVPGLILLKYKYYFVPNILMGTSTAEHR